MAIQLAQATSKLSAKGVKVAFASERGNGLIDVVRNTLVKRFLSETDYEKLLFIDSDIVASSDDILRLLALSTKYQVIGATYPIKRDENQGFFIRTLDDGPLVPNEDGLLEVKGFGAGFLCIDRQVFKQMESDTEEYQMDGKFHRFFQTAIVDGKYMGEDIWFLERWHSEFGGTVMLDPWISLQHVGKKYYDYKFSDWLNEESRQDAP